jgi:hypothetical protein
MKKNKGVLLSEVILSLFIDIIIFSIFLFVVIIPLVYSFDKISDQYVVSEVYTTMRAASSKSDDNVNNQITLTGNFIYYKNFRFLNNSFLFFVDSNNPDSFSFYQGQFLGRGGRIQKFRGDRLFNVTPVTGILTD